MVHGSSQAQQRRDRPFDTGGIRADLFRTTRIPGELIRRVWSGARRCLPRRLLRRLRRDPDSQDDERTGNDCPIEATRLAVMCHGRNYSRARTGSLNPGFLVPSPGPTT